jgi:hypothetical protein
MWRWLRRLFSRRPKAPTPAGWTQVDRNGHAFAWLEDDPDPAHWDWLRLDPREDEHARTGRWLRQRH